MRRTLTVATMVAALALSSLAPAMAKNGNGNNGVNSLRAASTPVDVSVDERGDWYVITHGLGADADSTVWAEPVKYANDNQQATGSEEFDALWLFAPSHERGHKGQVTVYYDLGDEWQHITAQFNGKGELVRVNGQRVK